MTVSIPQLELFFALVTPAGAPTRRTALADALASILTDLGFETVPVKLSRLLERCPTVWTVPPDASQETRIGHLQKIGNSFRKDCEDGGALARAALAAIREARMLKTANPNTPGARVAYVLDQLKHPKEVDLLREVYGSSFFLIGGHASEQQRANELAAFLAEQAGRTGKTAEFLSAALNLIRNDDAQEDDYGQNTRDTYPKADFFIDLALKGGELQVRRFVELIFGFPAHTPTQDEYAMYQASAASLRSSDTSRQVGAAIATKEGDVVAVGTNEVPKYGGGQYWHPASPDNRDQALAEQGIDRAKSLKIDALAEILERLSAKQWLKEEPGRSAKQKAEEILPALKGTHFMNIGEFGRPVHAEMAALIDAARRGVSVNQHAMYATTFPCHNCAKHILAAGLTKVIFLEPYPKSQAVFLHDEDIDFDPGPDRANLGRKLLLERFSGLAPRQYQQLFSMADRGVKKGYPVKAWNAERKKLQPRYVSNNAPKAYLAAECQELEKLRQDKFDWDKKKLCP